MLWSPDGKPKVMETVLRLAEQRMVTPWHDGYRVGEGDFNDLESLPSDVDLPPSEAEVGLLGAIVDGQKITSLMRDSWQHIRSFALQKGVSILWKFNSFSRGSRGVTAIEAIAGYPEAFQEIAPCSKEMLETDIDTPMASKLFGNCCALRPK